MGETEDQWKSNPKSQKALNWGIVGAYTGLGATLTGMAWQRVSGGRTVGKRDHDRLPDGNADRLARNDELNNGLVQRLEGAGIDVDQALSEPLENMNALELGGDAELRAELEDLAIEEFGVVDPAIIGTIAAFVVLL